MRATKKKKVGVECVPEQGAGAFPRLRLWHMLSHTLHGISAADSQQDHGNKNALEHTDRSGRKNEVVREQMTLVTSLVWHHFQDQNQD